MLIGVERRCFQWLMMLFSLKRRIHLRSLRSAPTRLFKT